MPKGALDPLFPDQKGTQSVALRDTQQLIAAEVASSVGNGGDPITRALAETTKIQYDALISAPRRAKPEAGGVGKIKWAALAHLQQLLESVGCQITCRPSRIRI